MGPEQSGSSQPTANDLQELRSRIERLEQEVAILRRQSAPVAPEPPPVIPPPPPRPPVVVAHTEIASIPMPSFASASSPPPALSLENRLGSQVFNRIGIVALLFGAAWGLKLAIDNQLIGPIGRILIGLIAGAGIIFWSESFGRQGIRAFSYSLKAVGTGVLYLSLWAAFQLYHLLPASAALGAMVLVTAWNAFMAWSQDAELLAAYALIGGFATPALLSTGGNHEFFLFFYVLALNVATAVVIHLKLWSRLLLGTFPVTILYFAGWYIEYNNPNALTITSIFLVLFWLTFLSISIARSQPARRAYEAHLADIVLPLANAVFVSLGFYVLLEDSHHHAALPWLMLLLAAIYLGIMRLPQRRVAAALHLSLAVVFLTIAVPLKASGHWITVAWLIEGVALYWVSTRLANSEPTTELRDETVLRWLASAALLLGFIAIFLSSYWLNDAIQPGFFNHDFATALLGITAFAATAWLSYRSDRQESLPVVFVASIGVDALGLLLTWREIALSPLGQSSRRAFFNSDFAMALVGIAVLAAVSFASLSIARESARAWLWKQLAAGSIIALNLVTVLCGVVEIHALWSDSLGNASAGLKQALAVSAFLMAYSAFLLAVGFWKRTAFIRWQGLALLVFTIAKTFLYDMRSLSQGYRVVSFLGLGVLLMAVSFAYQKDWLNLREPSSSSMEDKA